MALGTGVDGRGPYCSRLSEEAREQNDGFPRVPQSLAALSSPLGRTAPLFHPSNIGVPHRMSGGIKASIAKNKFH